MFYSSSSHTAVPRVFLLLGCLSDHTSIVIIGDQMTSALRSSSGPNCARMALGVLLFLRLRWSQSSCSPTDRWPTLADTEGTGEELQVSLWHGSCCLALTLTIMSCSAFRESHLLSECQITGISDC